MLWSLSVIHLPLIQAIGCPATPTAATPRISRAFPYSLAIASTPYNASLNSSGSTTPSRAHPALNLSVNRLSNPTFVHSNQVQCPVADTNSHGGGESGPPPTPSFASAALSEPLAKRADGSGSAVALCICPPGFDLSPFIIFDPATGEWASGVGCVVSQPSRNRMQPNDPQPQDGPTDDPTVSGPGFYRVVANGLRFFGLTNGAVLSGVADVPVEMSLTSTGKIYACSFGVM